MSIRMPLTVAVLAAAFVASPLHAQDAETPPEVRVVTVNTFNVPYNADRPTVMAFLDKWFVEPARLNPNVLHYRIVQHWFGNRAGDILIIVEYPDWAAVTATCEPCNAYVAANTPAEGTPERAKNDADQETFLKYYSNHQDEIYSASMARAKQ